MTLSPEQQYAFSKFKQGQNLFIGGPGGSGKSYFIKYVVEYLFKHGIIHQVTSTTGCSSVLLSNNIHINHKPITVKTIHSWSGIRLGKGPIKEILSNVLKREAVVREWRRNKVLIIDEISMLCKKLFNVLDLIGRTVHNRMDIPFGGMQIVCLGDFYQLPPIGDRGDPDSYSFCFESDQWVSTFPIENHIEFTTIFRQTDDTFKRILNEIRCGKLSDEGRDILTSRVDIVYDPTRHNGILPMKMFATRNQVTTVNQTHYQELSGQEHLYQVSVMTNVTKYIDSGNPFEPEIVEKISTMNQYETENECKSMTQNLPVEMSFGLKTGAIVMCLVNLDISLGIANGSMGRVIGFTYSAASKQEVPIVEFINGTTQLIDTYLWQSAEFPNICVVQVPLCLAYANSIHKMQGASLDICEMNLGGSIFSEHQIYVALSRVRSLDGLYLTAFHPHRIKVNPIVVEFYSKFVPMPTMENTEEDDSPPFTSTPTPGIGECPICLNRCNDPYITSCKHTFCHSCILRLLQCSIRENATCPMCRDPISVETMHAVSKPYGGGGKPNHWRNGSSTYGTYGNSYKVTKI